MPTSLDNMFIKDLKQINQYDTKTARLQYEPARLNKMEKDNPTEIITTLLLTGIFIYIVFKL